MVLKNRLISPDWEEARCRQFAITRDEDGLVRNDTWFQDAAEALPICNGDYTGSPCPMRSKCLFQSLTNNDGGVWGGMTLPQRRWIRRNVPRDKWEDEEYLRNEVPPPERFKDLGDEDPEEEDKRD